MPGKNCLSPCLPSGSRTLQAGRPAHRRDVVPGGRGIAYFILGDDGSALRQSSMITAPAAAKAAQDVRYQSRRTPPSGLIVHGAVQGNGPWLASSPLACR